MSKKYAPPKYRIYGKEVREGYEAPCFFTEIIDGGSSAETKNFVKSSFIVKIIYFQKQKNELDQLEKADEIKTLFALVFSVGNRHLTVGRFTHDFIGEYQDILQISIEIDYLENTQKKDTAPIAETLGVKIIKG